MKIVKYAVFMIFSMNLYASSFEIGTIAISNTVTMTSAKKVITKVYQGLGKEIQIKEIPHMRSMVLLNEGKLDAELCRYGRLEKLYLNIIKVKPAVLTTKLALFYVDKKFDKVSVSQDDLKRYKLASMDKAAFLDNLPKSIKYLEVNKFSNLFKLLIRKRVDFALLPQVEYDFIKKINPLIKLKKIESNNLTISCHHYLSLKNKSLYKKVSEQLKKFQK